ncbi:hypothetical protein P4S63_01785 [Pseudoalteromonas sp. B193]
MECFDISHTMGRTLLQVVLYLTHKARNTKEYRRYNVTGITGGDDYAAMEFALNKHYNKLVDEDKIPDVIFIDGGRGSWGAEQYFSNWPHTKMPC